MRYQKNGKVITASKKAYNTIYKEQGYEPVIDNVETEAGKPDWEPEEGVNLEGMTVEELRAVAKEKGITGVSALKKDELLALLKDVDAGE